MKRDPRPKGLICVEFYLDLYCRLVGDIANSFGAQHKKESELDIVVIRRRVHQEGLSFLTKALPKLGKAIDRSLGQGSLFAPQGFRKKPSSTIPKLFGWLFEQVFDSSGKELPDAAPQAVKALRQLVYVLYKLEIPFTQEQADNVCELFRRTDAELPEVIPDEVIRHARNFVTNVLGSFDPYDISPRHGPGAVATGEKNHEKHRFSRLYESIEVVYPFSEYFVYGLSHLVDDPSYIKGLRTLQTGTAKVVLVPKDSRGPRLISCEPLEYQWVQQGLGNAIRATLESSTWTRGHVNFRDQETNRRLARAGSLTGKWVTLDMKEASDRVSVQLVKQLFADCPVLLDCLLATRTPETKLPNGDIVWMKKFAPMGSNLCFPIESLVFFALAVGCLVAKDMHHIARVKPDNRVWQAYASLMKRHASRVFVYGDDLIVRAHDYELLLQYFPKVGLMFNEDKCCTHGSFRESCGFDAYKGVDVTPLRLKRVWDRRPKRNAVVLASYVAFSNAAYERGYHQVSELVAQTVESKLGPIPVLPELDLIPNREYRQHYGVLAWIRPGSHVTRQPRGVQTRWNSSLQRYEVRSVQVVPRKISLSTSCWCMVLRRLTSPSEHDEPGTFALTHRVTLRCVWTAPAI
jgi:hypothetical protein